MKEKVYQFTPNHLHVVDKFAPKLPSAISMVN